MKCTKCGNENKEGAKFCRKCGAKLEDKNDKEQEGKEQVEQVKEKQEEKKQEAKQEKQEEKKQEAKQEKQEEKKQEAKQEKQEEKKQEPKQEAKQEKKQEQKQEDKTKKEPKNKEKKADKKPKEKSKGKKIFIFIIVIAILAGLGYGAYFVWDEFIYKYDAKIEDNLDKYYDTNDQKYLDKLQDIILKYSSDEDTQNKISEVVNQKIENWIETANTAEYTTSEEVEKAFSQIEEKIKNLQSVNIIDKDTKEKYTNKIENLEESKANYLEGLSMYESEDYDKSYTYFAKVIADDKLYEQAQEYVDKCMGDTITKIEEEYKEKINVSEGATSTEIQAKYIEAFKYLINKDAKTSIDLDNSETYRNLVTESITKIVEENANVIKDNITKKEYSLAKSNIIEIVGYISEISSNKEYKELISTSLNSLTEQTISVVDAMIAEYSYSDATTLLTDVKTEMEEIKNSTTNVETLQEKASEIEDKMPISLLSLTTRSKDSSISIRNYGFTDADNTEYDKGITSYCNWQETYNCTYNLNGSYSRLKATYGVCQASSSNDTPVYIKIYGDDKLLYTSDAIKWDSLPKELDVNISGVQMLKIEFVSDKLNRDVFIGNPELYK
jgi:hypothetical protein